MSFPFSHTSVLISHALVKCLVVFCARATTTQLYPGQSTFEFDQGHITKNQPNTMLLLLNESLGI